ncbi:hypothetical protein [Rhodococcus sp. UNC363MFTsu5.1]|nr:hypothetical protein [Rhodococcus sp. UNC363MFTsu5.1]
MKESHWGLIIATASLIANIVTVIQNRKVKPKRQPKHRQRKR